MNVPGFWFPHPLVISYSSGHGEACCFLVPHTCFHSLNETESLKCRVLCHSCLLWPVWLPKDKFHGNNIANHWPNWKNEEEKLFDKVTSVARCQPPISLPLDMVDGVSTFRRTQCPYGNSRTGSRRTSFRETLAATRSMNQC